jgi:hypothetical protein
MSRARRTLWQRWGRGWKRDLIAYPLVFVLTLLGMAALHGRDWHLDGGTYLSLLIVGTVAWVVALRLVDWLFGRRSGPGWEKP